MSKLKNFIKNRYKDIIVNPSPRPTPLNKSYCE